MRVEELGERDLKKNPLMVVDPNLDKFKDSIIPQFKTESVQDIIDTPNFKEVFPNLKD